MKEKKLSLILSICLLLSGCSASRQPYSPPDYSTHTNADESRYHTVFVDLETLKEGLPVLALYEDPAELTFSLSNVKTEYFGYDLRSRDASQFDFSLVSNFTDISFSTDTIWPSHLPAGFNPEEILELNKNPGLGIRELHEQGITGKGVGVAIIDQALLPEHEQYKDNLMLYEQIHCSDSFAQMHAGAVASIAVGKDIGVAPGASLYYIASTFGHYSKDDVGFDAAIIADCILRVLEINDHLSNDEKIRVIAISKGYSRNDPGYKELTAAIRQADSDGIFVITTSPNLYYNFELCGLGRDYWSDADDILSFTPATWYADIFYANPKYFKDCLFVPMESRTISASTGNSNYEISRNGGLSWTVPWLAGFYALCCQVKPNITPQEFISVLYKTSVASEINYNGKFYHFEHVVDTAAAINQLERK